MRSKLRVVAVQFRSIKELPKSWEEAFPAHAALVDALEQSAYIIEEELVQLYRERTPSVQFLAFLWGAYESRWYMWECVECIRRMTLTGMLVFIEPGTKSQVIAAAMIALAWLSMCVGLANLATPFEKE